MPNIIGFSEWRTQNRATKYPFAEHATLTSTGGATIVEGAFIDASIYPVGGSAGMYISSVTVTSTTVTLKIGTSDNPALCSGVMDALQIPTEIKLEDDYGRPAGLLVSEGTNLGALRALGLGTHNFSKAATEFCATVCLPMPDVAVRGFLLDDGSILTGQVWIMGEDGVVVRHVEQLVTPACGTPYYQDAIRIDVVGDPLFRRRLCSGQVGFNTVRPITAVQVKLGDEYASMPMTGFEDFQLKTGDHSSASSVLRVVNTEDGIDIHVAGP